MASAETALMRAGGSPRAFRPASECADPEGPSGAWHHVNSSGVIQFWQSRQFWQFNRHCSSTPRRCSEGRRGLYRGRRLGRRAGGPRRGRASHRRSAPPARRARARDTAESACRSSMSTAASGSSSSSSSGPDISARASATRWRSPPRAARTPRSSSGRDLENRRHRRESRLLPGATAVEHVAAHVRWGKSATSWARSRRAAGAAARRRGRPRRRAPAMPTMMRPGCGRRRPAMASSMVVFPDARRPEERGDPAVELLVDLEREVPLPQREVERDHARTPARAAMPVRQPQTRRRRSPRRSRAGPPPRDLAGLGEE